MGTGPVTGHLERPSQETSETRKAEFFKPQRDIRRAACRALKSLCAAEMALLVAMQRDERRQAVAALEASLSARHVAQTSATVSRFAGQRAAAALIASESERLATLARLAAEEQNELLRLVLDHSAEQRRVKNALLVQLLRTQRTIRRALSQRHRRERLVFSVARYGRSNLLSRVRSLGTFSLHRSLPRNPGSRR